MKATTVGRSLAALLEATRSPDLELQGNALSLAEIVDEEVWVAGLVSAIPLLEWKRFRWRLSALITGEMPDLSPLECHHYRREIGQCTQA